MDFEPTNKTIEQVTQSKPLSKGLGHYKVYTHPDGTTWTIKEMANYFATAPGSYKEKVAFRNEFDEKLFSLAKVPPPPRKPNVQVRKPNMKDIQDYMIDNDIEILSPTIRSPKGVRNTTLPRMEMEYANGFLEAYGWKTYSDEQEVPEMFFHLDEGKIVPTAETTQAISTSNKFDYSPFDNVDDPDDMIELVKEHGVPPIRPTVVSHESSTFDGSLSQLDWSALDDQVENVPVVTLTMNKEYVPTPNNSVKAIPYSKSGFFHMPFDAVLLNVMYDSLVSGSVGNKDDHSVYLQTYKECVDIANNFIFSSGSVMGQLGRLTKTLDVHEWYKQRKLAKAKIEVKQKYYKTVFASTIGWDRSKGIPDLREYDMFVVYNQTVTNALSPLDKIRLEKVPDSERPAIMQQMKEEPINKKMAMNSNAGVCWRPSKKNKDLIASNQILANKMMKIISQGGSEALWKTMPWLRITNMSAKAEVYKRTEIYTKTRNIFISNSFAMYPAQVLWTRAPKMFYNFEDKPFVYTMETAPKGSVNMSGWTPYNGGMQRLMDTWFALKGLGNNSVAMAVYADNMFIFQHTEGRFLYAFLDGEKNESTIGLDDTTVWCHMLADHFGDKIGETYYRYLTEVYPTLCSDSVANLLNHQIHIPHLASGVVGTYAFNLLRMSCAVHEVSKIAQPPLYIDENNQVAVNEFVFKAARGACVKLRLERTAEFTSQLTKHALRRPFLELEVLGFGCATFTIDENTNVLAPVLHRERLLKMLIFVKTRSSDVIPDAFLRLVRMKAAFMLGAWYDETLMFYVEKAAKSARRSLFNHLKMTKSESLSIDEDLIQEMSSQLAETTRLDQANAEVIEAIVQTTALPNYYDMVKLITGDHDMAIRAVKYYRTRVRTEMLAPRKVLKDLNIKYVKSENAYIEDIPYIVYSLDRVNAPAVQYPGMEREPGRRFVSDPSVKPQENKTTKNIRKPQYEKNKKVLKPGQSALTDKSYNQKMRLVNKTLQGKKVFRVPMEPYIYDNMADPTKTYPKSHHFKMARAQMANQLSSYLNVPKLDAIAILRKYPHVYYIVSGEDIKDIPNSKSYQFSAIDKSSKRLKFGKLFPREEEGAVMIDNGK